MPLATLPLSLLPPSAGTVFRERCVSVDPLAPAEWGTWEHRLGRYRLLWAFFEGTAYSDVHRWALSFRSAYTLYAHTRNIYGVAFRLGEFWARHLMGGCLDLAAGDGDKVPSALPILIDDETRKPDLRGAIGRLWRESNWQVAKEVWTRWGAVLGDTFLAVVDDPTNQRVYLQPINPATVRKVQLDRRGNVKGYVIQEYRPDPESPWEEWDDGAILALYTEVCTRDGDEITFATYRDQEPYDWRRDDPDSPGDTWTENYGFVPLVAVKHLDVGHAWGWGEFLPALPKMRELDDLGCVLTDQARRILNAPWLVNGRPPSAEDLGADDDDAEAATPRTGERNARPRSDDDILWIDRDGAIDAKQLVGTMPIGEVLQHIDRLGTMLERDYPELLIDGTAISGDSGRKVRIVRQGAEQKVHARRAAYDDALRRAQMMALSMGGTRPGKPRAYPGYEGIDQRSYRAGDLEHSIGPRPVFAVDPLDDIEEEQARGTALKTYSDTDKRLLVIGMRRLKFADEEIAEVEAEPEPAAPTAPVNGQALAQTEGPPTDRMTPLYARPPVPMETRQGA